MGPKTLIAHLGNYAKVARYCTDTELETRCDALILELRAIKRQHNEVANSATLAVKLLQDRGILANIGQLPAWWNS